MLLLFLACRPPTTGTSAPEPPSTDTSGDTASPTGPSTPTAATADTAGTVAPPEPWRATWIRAWSPAPALLAPSPDGGLLAVAVAQSGGLELGIGDPDLVADPTRYAAWLVAVDPATGAATERHRLADLDGLPSTSQAPDPAGIVFAANANDPGTVFFPDHGGPVLATYDEWGLARVDPSGAPRWISLFRGANLEHLATGPDGAVYACGQAINDEIRMGHLSAQAGWNAGFAAAWEPTGEPRWLLVEPGSWCGAITAGTSAVWLDWDTQVLQVDAGTGARVRTRDVNVQGFAAVGDEVDVLAYVDGHLQLLQLHADGTIVDQWTALRPTPGSPGLARRSGGWRLHGSGFSVLIGEDPAPSSPPFLSNDLFVGFVDESGHGSVVLDAGTTSLDFPAGVVELADGGLVGAARGAGYIGAQRTTAHALGHVGGEGWLVRWDPPR